jgi:hypothetical protein
MPHLFSRGRGMLKWEKKDSKEKQRKLTSKGDKEELSKYKEDRVQELLAEVAAMKKASKDAMESSQNAIPYPNAE